MQKAYRSRGAPFPGTAPGSIRGFSAQFERDSWCWFFGAIDHHLDEVIGWHTAKLGDRWAALEPIRQCFRTR
jgi:hypothetical protein